MKLKPIDYLFIVLEAMPCGLPLALDYKMSRKIKEESKDLIDKSSLEYTKSLAVAADQQLRLDPDYKSFRLFDGVLTCKTKEEILEVLNNLRKRKQNEKLYKPYPSLKMEEIKTSTEPEIKVILPNSIKE